MRDLSRNRLRHRRRGAFDAEVRARLRELHLLRLEDADDAIRLAVPLLKAATPSMMSLVESGSVMRT